MPGVIPIFEPGRFEVIAIASSTGGPGLLEAIISGLPADLSVPILVAQHLPPTFTPDFARMIDQKGALTVYHAEHGMPVFPGTVYIGEGHKHLRVERGRDGGCRIVVSPLPSELVYKPSANELFTSCAAVYGSKVLAIVMTGIGTDGLTGAQRVVSSGGMVITQSRSSCVVYGMPRACDEAGLSSASLDPEQIRLALLQFSPSQRKKTA